MAASLEHVLAQLQRWTSPHLEECSDAVLLERFVQLHDESAFAALLARHGGMVWHSCRRILDDSHEAEDAFQATFLILARQAHTLRHPAALPGFLHRVARRVALKARTKASDCASETPLVDKKSDPRSDPLMQLTARELLTVLDEEIARLPATQRSAIVLCCLEGHPREEAAKMLGCTPGALKGHLERGRQRLQKRLEHRGITLSAALVLVMVAREGIAAQLPALLLQSTVRAALHGCTGGTASALAHSVLQTMFLPKLAGVMAVTLTLVLAASATVALIYRGPAVETVDEKKPAISAASTETGAGKSRPRTDAQGDLLPAEAIARLGTQRFRHGGQIMFAAFTPDGKRLISQGYDGVRVWNVATGKQLRYFAAEPGNYWGATDLSADGKTLAADSKSHDKIDLWDVPSGKIISSLGRGIYTRIRLSPNGKLLAAYLANADTKLAVVELWDVVSRRKLRAWKPHPRSQVMCLLFSADSRQLLTSGLDGNVRLWDTQNDQQLQEFTRSGRRWYASSFDEAISPDGKLVALFEQNEKSILQTGAIVWQARISLRDTATGKQVRLLSCPSQKDHTGEAPAFSAITFTPDGKKLLTGGPDRFLRAWDAATGDELQRWPLELGRPFPLTLSPDGKTLAAVMRQGRAIQLLDMANGKPRPALAGHLAHVKLSALTSDGRFAITVDAEGALFLWDATAGRIRRALKGHDGPIFSLQLAPDGRTLYTLGWDKTLRFWDLGNGEERRRISLGQEFAPSGYGALALSPDGGTLAVLGSTKANRLLDTTSGRELHRFEGPKWIRGAAFTADGRSLVVWSGDMQVRICDGRTGRLLRTYPLPKEFRSEGGFSGSLAPPAFFNAAVSPDGRLLALCHFTDNLDKSKYIIILKDLATGRDVRRLDHLPANVDRLAFAPDGRLVAWSGEKDCSIHLVETASGGERRRLPGHTGGRIHQLAFSADGTRLISSGSETTALVWDVRGPSEHLPATAAEMEALWIDLAGTDANRAYRAIRKFAAAPAAAVPLLRERLRPVPDMDAKRLARLIEDLDSDDFAIRQKATADLEEFGERALPAFRKALEGKAPLETRRRLEDLRDEAQRAWWDVSGERLQLLRAVEALELAGTKEAREALQTLAAGAAGARLTEEAKAALERLQR